MDKNVVLFVASYDDKENAEADMKELNELAKHDILNDVAIALVFKDENGKIKVHQETNAGKAVATVGVLGGAIIGAIFPPAGLALLGGAIAGGATLGVIGGLVGHFAGGLSRKDLKSVGEMLEEGEATIILVAEDEKADKADAALARASRKAKRLLDKGDVDAALEALDEGVDKAVEEESS